MDKEKLVSGIIGGIVAGFSIGVGFLISQRMMGKFFNSKAKEVDTSVSDAVKKGVSEGVKQAKMEEDAANFAAMNANNGSKGRSAMHKMNPRSNNFMGFDGNPNSMSFNGDPLLFRPSPNGNLNG